MRPALGLEGVLVSHAPELPRVNAGGTLSTGHALEQVGGPALGRMSWPPTNVTPNAAGQRLRVA